MSAVPMPILSFAAGYHQRARPLCDGRVKLKSFDLKAEAFEDDGEGHEQFLAGRCDAGEFLSQIIARSRAAASPTWRFRFSPIASFATPISSYRRSNEVRSTR